ncbi:MAG TPA: hydroxysqualene dehydroxylase HpnE [Terriglobia bacterium]|nr:hydroxysqualene dehydroxylase HpnE [Terriglobia bacterium]
MKHDVLIVGGGFAGLSAGVALARAGCSVRLIEQKPYLGGRARSFVDSTTGCVVDNGQHLFMGCYHDTLRFLETIGTLDRIRFQPRLTLQFLDRQGNESSLTCPNLPAPWHLLAGVLVSNNFTSREKLQILRLGRALDSSSRDRPCPSGQLTVDEWLARLGQSENLRRNFWDLLAIAAMNEDSRIASAAVFERVLRLALFRSPADSRLGLAVTGLSECYTQAATDFIAAHGGNVETGCDVSSFLIADGECRGVELRDGARLEARFVLSAVPCFSFVELLPADLPRSKPFFERLLSLSPAPIISINFWFDRPLTDQAFIGLRGTTVQWLFNKGKILSDSGLRTPDSGLSRGSYISLVISGAHEHIARPKEDLQALALRELGELIPLSREANLLHSLILKERFATFSPTPAAESVRPPATTPVRNLYLAGDWTSTGLPATIEGAVKSGYTAAQAILEAA